MYKKSVVLMFPPSHELLLLSSPVCEQKTEKKQEDHCLGFLNFPTQGPPILEHDGEERRGSSAGFPEFLLKPGTTED